MLISALNEYYDCLAEAGRVCPEGCSYQKISHMIMLAPDGSISDIIDIREAGEPDKKGKIQYNPIDMLLPERTQKPGIDFNIIEHRPLYIFGLNYNKGTGTFTPDDGKNRARKSHECFVKGNLEYIEGMSGETVERYRRFIESWNPENETENEHLLKLGKIYAAQGTYFCFAPDGHPENPLNSPDSDIMRRVMSERNEPDGDEYLCPVLGEKLPAARIHGKIKGVLGGKATGGLLVCFNSAAEESYGKSQSYNTGISYRAMKRYTEALNILISDRHHRMYLDDMTIVFFAMTKDDSRETDMFQAMFGNESSVKAEELDTILNSAFQELEKGRSMDLSSLDIDENTMFYMAGLTPNNSRIAQKFLYRGKFGAMFNNVVLHQLDMRIEGSKGQLPLWRIFSELKSPKSKNEKTPPPLMASLFSAVLNGGKYPEQLLETAVRRVKTDKAVNYARAGIIKGCINRKSRLYKGTEEITMALDTGNTNQAYLCGRLFAVLEKIQQNASGGGLNRTIKDSFFASACAKPCAVFPRLMTLAQYHLKNDEYAVSNNKIIGEILDKLGGSFPSTLPLNEQGKFIIGYYHQYQN
ncbi:MAG: type I-C CRISPR-associated protein Cas8c/Csd1, partial [Firmicutes bacterium]|nr:type I-C CRISPR-associated protein Cas8c/Csd1 [Bacillota bacterium]